MKLSHFDSDSPTVDNKWQQLSDEQKLINIKKITSKISKYDSIDLLNAKSNGEVLIKLNEPIPASERGVFIIEYELLLKERIDRGIVVWCSPLGDKNSLRNLRGININGTK
jgi:hypothetical protein